MSGNSDFHILTAIILALFALVFGILHFSNRRNPFCGWVALAYAAALAGYLIDSTRTSATPIIWIMVSTIMFWLFSLAIAQAIYVRANIKFPAILATLIFASSVALFILLAFVQPDISLRSILVNVSAGVLLALALPPLWKSGRGAIDWVLFGVIALVAATFIARVIFVYFLLDDTLTEQSYSQSTYAWIFHFTSGVCGLGLALTLLFAAGLDMVLHYHAQSNLDPLTGLLNRRGLKTFFNSCPDERESATVARSLIIFDIDHFKQVNDRYGHAVGDKVLQRIAKTATGLCQEYGRVARTGGEEFAVLTHRIPIETAQFLAQHICDSLRFVAHPELDANHKVTASFGLALLTGADSLFDGMDRADKALYHAKRNGRNQVALSQAA